MFKINLLCFSLMLLLATHVGAAEQIWQPVIQAQARAATATLTERQYQVDNQALRALLQRVSDSGGPGAQRIISLPMPDGSLADFEIYESPIMADELARRYPEIKTYKVYGIDDPIASGRIDITAQGFHAMLHTSQGRLFIDPHQDKQLSDRYQARTQQSAAATGYSCSVDDYAMPAVAANQSMLRPTAARIAGSFLSYRLAVSATVEYVAAVGGGTVAGGQAAIVTAINRVNEIYQRDLGIQLMLVDDNEDLIENPGDDTFSNGDPFQMFIENQAWIDSIIGSSNYDIGHVFGTAGGGLASLGSACDSDNKARGVSAILPPINDPFWIDFVSHEIGHQLNADHSFNGSSLSCSLGRNPATAFEPGSGSTVMAYAGICGVEDIQNSSDATFHAASIAQIDSFTKGEGSCYARIPASPANPNDPQVNAIANRTIPADTAFVLAGFASDADGHPLSYQWDQMDVGCPTDARSFGTDTGFNGLFRSYLPRDTAVRHFPAMGTQLDGLYDDAEVLPCNNRDINLRFTARDGHSGQGTADVRVTVQDTGEAFEITNLNDGATIPKSTSFDVEWRVADTTEAPISCDSVDIDLLSFNAALSRYSVIPLQKTFNGGSATVSVVPNTDTHEYARIRVACSNNVFYDISDITFRVEGTGAGIFSDFRRDVFYNKNGTTGRFAPVCGAIAKCSVESEDSGGGGSSALDYRWLVLLAVLLLLARVRRANGARV
jgi:MYXO-CTERM domain-containing protein